MKEAERGYGRPHSALLFSYRESTAIHGARTASGVLSYSGQGLNVYEAAPAFPSHEK
jgi:hypothetical protein